jgi:FtsP/CotA-like multicopper oxidase with cupredoxin domain
MSPESPKEVPPRNRSTRTLLAVILVSVVVAGSLMVMYIPKITQSEILTGGNGSNTVYPPYTNLPAGCVKPPGGFLIVADINGFNDSIQHGAPSAPWPIINVSQGQTVNITVCNSDHQSHGFQVTHYFDSNIETVEPGQVAHVSFVANKLGTFEIYCSIFCSIHIYMQNAQLRVLAT